MLTRRSLLFSLAALPLAAQKERAAGLELRSVERSRVLRAADRYLREQPITITASRSARSSGGLHDYFSEGDYWWPDPTTPDGPYIQKDGMTNPDNFVDHRHALMRLSVQMPALTAAWVLTGEKRYASHAVRHLRAWFLDERTLMSPHLLYAQAIKGRFTGRGIGIIDTLHLVEVVRAVAALERSDAFDRAARDGVRAWFDRYLTWMTTHEYGQTERDAKNNHGTCWVLQVAELARHTGRHDLTAFCRQRYKTVIVPGQIAVDGSFPEELRRTKPYGYSLFNLDAMAGICQVLSTGDDNLWTFALPDGRGIGRALEFLVPYIADKRAWKHPPDVMYFDEWPVRHCLLLFGGLALGRRDYLDLWLKLNPDPTVTEVVRNFFIRQPLLWVTA